MEIENTPEITAEPVKANLISIDDFAKIELRVAEILSAEPLPKSNKLMKLQVTLGEALGQRQVLAGIAKHYTPEDLVGRKIIIIANLQPAKLMGEESQGMLLAADGIDDIILLAPSKDAPVGARVR